MHTSIRRWCLAFMSVLMLASFIAPAGSVRAAEQVDKLPPVNNIATTRMRILVTRSVDGAMSYSYGRGALVTPNRQEYWLTDDGKSFYYYVQVGDRAYERVDNGAWQESVGGELPALGDQFNAVQELASSIYRIGDAQIDGRPVAHYQAWVSGSRLAELTGVEAENLKGVSLKFDYWIGADGYLYQENSVLMFEAGALESGSPAIMSSTLITYFDINNPNISINLPR